MRLKLRYVLLVLMICTTNSIFAAREVQAKGYALASGLELPVLSVNSIVTLQDPYWGQEYYPCGIDDCSKQYSQKVSLLYTRAFKTDISSNFDWHVKITYDVYENGSLQSPSDRELTIGTDGIGQTNTHSTYSDEADLLLQGNVITIKIKAIDHNLSTDEMKDIRIEFDLIKENNRDVRTWTQNDFGYKIVNEEILAHWQYVAGAEKYELQWVYVDQQDDNFAAITTSNVFNHSDLSATITLDQHYKEPVSVITTEQYFKVYDVFNSGNVFMRVRPIGFHVNTNDGVRDHIQVGAWSDVLVYNIVNGFETEHNWQYAVTYAEDAKNKKIITYSDGSLRGRQSLTVLSTDGRTAISDQNYDHEGRSSLNVLPVPVAGVNLHHVDMFNRKGPSVEYTKADYDIAPTNNGVLVAALDDSYGAARFYSANNSIAAINQAYVPDALGYPFTQTIYTRDGTGRVARSGGLGPDFQISSGRETKFFYGNTNETELHRLFGSNVGKASHYKKNLTVDPNGQISVAYLDQEGRTIATALAGISPGNVIPLTDNNQEITSSLNGNNTLSVEERKSYSTNIITNAIPNTDYEFNYDFTGVKNSLGEPFNLCLTCSYKLTIFITDPSGATVPINDIDNTTNVNSISRVLSAGSSYNCETNSFGPVEINFEAEFEEIGQYTVTKILEITSDQLDGYVEEGSIGTNYPNLTDLVNEYAEGIDYTLCNVTCEQHFRLPCYLELSISSETDYAELTTEQKKDVDDCVKKKCLEKAEDAISNVQKSDCESILGQMKADLRPEANYHWWAGDDEHHPKNILDAEDDDVVSDDEVISNGDGTIKVFVRDLLNASVTEFTNQSSLEGTPETVELEDWMLDELVKSHREYCHYQYCIANTTSDEYDVHMMMISSFEEASNATDNWNNANFLDPLNNLAVSGAFEDPYFTTTPGSTFKSTVASQVYTNYNSTGASLMQYMAPPPPPSVVSAPPYIGLSTNAYGGVVPAVLQNVYDYQAHLMAGGTVSSWTPVPTEAENRQAIAYKNVDWNDINTVNAQHWNLWKGRYQSLKLEAQANYEESQGCVFYEDAHKITKDPRNTITTQDEAMDFVNEHIEDLNHDACNANLIAWRYNIETHCGIIEDADWYPFYYLKLKHYCEAHAGIGNPMGQILSTDLTSSEMTSDPDLWQVKTWLEAGMGLPDDEPCNFPETMIVPGGSDPGSSALVTQLNSCFKTFIDALFVAFNLQTPNYTGLFACYNSAPIITAGDFFTLTPVPGSGARCAPYFLFLDNDLNYIPYSTLLNTELISTTYDPIGPTTTGTCVGCTTEPTLANPTNYTGAKVRIKKNGEYKDLWIFRSIASDCAAYTEGKLMTTPPSVTEDEFNIVDTAYTRCIRALQAEANYYAGVEWQQEVDGYNNALRATVDKCFENPYHEDFFVKYRLNEYQYTLYYYDQAGRLIQTVPPKGVAPVPSSNFSTSGVWNGTEPMHALKSIYKFNSLEAVREQITPDAGLAKFWYDAKGQLKLSQNAKQAAESSTGSYSVTVYDELGRVNWVSKMSTTFTLSTITRDALGDAFFPFNLNTVPTNYTEVTLTDYNRGAIAGLGNFTQRNLRGKVSASGYFNNLTDVVNGNKVYYSYDEHGNVESIQNFIYSNTSPIVKRTDYKYDLISGKVNKVTYQPGESDMFIHKYYYDADNRITNVFTSHDNILWEEDAEYFYAPHGPLTRTELGHDKVQGLDYYYTLQGWLKGVNTPVSDRNDIGNDAGSTGLNQWNGKDAMSFALGYYEGDYTPINPSAVSLGAAAGTETWPVFKNQIKKPSGTLPTGFKHGLFNGNIAWMITDLPGLSSSPTMQAMIYQYDQLNRLSKSFRGGDYYYAASEWNERTAAHLTGAYDEAYTYDGNGNIETLKRLDKFAGNIDDLTYSYTANTNRLNNVEDLISNDGCTGDCPNACGNYLGLYHLANGSHPYTYDEIGNLISDTKEDIDEIVWNTYGKITDIKYSTCSNRKDLRFLYDPTGNRVAKIKGVDGDQENWEYTYYVRDASGNVMAIYDRKYQTVHEDLQEQTLLVENPIYGSARVGNYAPNKMVEVKNVVYSGYNTGTHMFVSPTLTTVELSNAKTFKRLMALKQYELSNHLGNVLSTVTDRKMGEDANSDGISDYYKAEFISVQDYYPFGMAMPGRELSPMDYRYGFNGKEKDDEVKGHSGTSYDFGARIYDPRIGRWMSVDPKSGFYPGISPYAFAINNPIKLIDKDGGVVTDENGNIIYTVDRAGIFIPFGPATELSSDYITVVGYFGSEGRILTDNGSSVSVQKITDKTVYEVVVQKSTGTIMAKTAIPDLDASYNCTGNALANQEFVIYSNEITDAYKSNEGLAPVTSISGAGASAFMQNPAVTVSSNAGDVGMYEDNSGLVHHLEPYIDNSTVLTKGGIAPEGGPAQPGASKDFSVGSQWNLNGDGVNESTIQSYTVYNKTQTNTQIRTSDYSMALPSTSNKSVEVSNKTFDKIQTDVKK